MPLPSDTAAAAAVLMSKFTEGERKQNTLWSVIVSLYTDAGEPPPPRPSGGGGGSGSGVTAVTGGQMSIKPDQFFGQRQQTAIRQILEMRKAAGQGPAKPREIYDALKVGGYKFEAKEEATALVGLRNLLRKRSHVFTKLDSGSYGLREWYPHLKAAKPAADDADDESDAETETATSKKEAAAA